MKNSFACSVFDLLADNISVKCKACKRLDQTSLSACLTAPKLLCQTRKTQLLLKHVLPCFVCAWEEGYFKQLVDGSAVYE